MDTARAKAIHRLAVYGTLAPGRTNHEQMADISGRWFEGTVRGRLVQTGWAAALGFPGLVLDAEGQNVEVFVLESHELSDHWDRLDAFEGDSYRRVETLVRTEDGDIPSLIYVIADGQTGSTTSDEKLGLDAFPFRAADKLRYADTDRQGHVNNAVFSTFLETGRVELLHDEELADAGTAFVIVRLELDFLAEIYWPGNVEIGTAVKEIGRSSFKLVQRVFQEGKPVAEAVTTVVQLNESTRKSKPLSDDAHRRLADLIRPALST